MTKRFCQKHSEVILFKNCWLRDKSSNSMSEDPPSVFNDSSRAVIVNIDTVAEFKMREKAFFLSSYVGLLLLNYFSWVADKFLAILLLQNAFISRNWLQNYEACLLKFGVLYSLQCIQNTVIIEHLLINFKEITTSDSKIYFSITFPI